MSVDSMSHDVRFPRRALQILVVVVFALAAGGVASAQSGQGSTDNVELNPAPVLTPISAASAAPTPALVPSDAPAARSSCTPPPAPVAHGSNMIAFVTYRC